MLILPDPNLLKTVNKWYVNVRKHGDTPIGETYVQLDASQCFVAECSLGMFF